MKGIVFPLPPLAEQRRILEAIGVQTQNLIQAVEQARREIDLLREFRTRLIADVVTGKLDVRDAAARLPDDADAPEELDDVDPESDGDDADEGLHAETDEAKAQ